MWAENNNDLGNSKIPACLYSVLNGCSWRGSDLAQGRWDESPYWQTGTCPCFWLDPFILAGLLLLVAGSTQKESQEEINAEFAERKEEDDERAETGKPQSLQFFVFGRQYGLWVGKMHSAPSFKETPAIWASFGFEKSHHFSVTTKSPHILPLFHFLCTQKCCRLQTASSKVSGANSLWPRPRKMKLGIPGNGNTREGDSHYSRELVCPVTLLTFLPGTGSAD